MRDIRLQTIAPSRRARLGPFWRRDKYPSSMTSISIPRLPVVPDPLRRIKLPKDLDAVSTWDAEEEPSSAGLEPKQIESIWNATRAVYRSGVHPGIAVCVRRHGKVVLDRSIGHASGNGPGESGPAVLLSPQTPHCIFSASKAVTAMVVHLLDQQGALHIADRVADYIPEYSRHGKSAITIEHVLSHRAGVANIPGDAFDLDRAGDEEFILEILCDAKPTSRPGKSLAYHAVSGGFIMAEVVKRITGKTIREYLAEQILDPLGFRWTNYGVEDADVGAVARAYPSGAPTLPPLSNLLTRALGRPADEITEISNDPRFLTSIVPAGNTITTANELSRYFELLRRGGELDGKRIFEPRTLRRAISERSYLEVDFTLGFPSRYSCGFMLGARYLSLFGPDTELAFGHLGFTNILGWADPERALSVAIITSGKPILYPELPTFWNLMRTIGAAAPKVGPEHRAF